MRLNQFKYIIECNNNINYNNNINKINFYDQCYDLPILSNYKNQILTNWDNFVSKHKIYDTWSIDSAMKYAKCLYFFSRNNNQNTNKNKYFASLNEIMESLIKKAPNNLYVTKLFTKIKDDITISVSLQLKYNNNNNKFNSIIDNNNINNDTENNNYNKDNNINDFNTNTNTYSGAKDIDDVRIFLNKIGKLNEYYDLFISNGIDSNNAIILLDDNALQQIGINKIGHRLGIVQK